jgi:hypothetical protein
MGGRGMIDTPDSSDLDAIESLVISDGWALLSERVFEVIEDKRNALERSGDKADEHRGFLAACRMFLSLPKGMAEEIKREIGAK